MRSNQPQDITNITEDREFRAFHTFLRTARNYQEKEIYSATYQAYVRKCDELGVKPETADDVLAVMDEQPEYQLYTWCYRYLQQFKYCSPDFGIQPKAHTEADRIVKELDAAAAVSEKAGLLKLNPKIDYPDYYKLADFHQHPGGVWDDEVDGLVYELGRRTTRPWEEDPNDLYRLMYSHLPKGKTFKRVLDWGTGQGGMILTWLEGHPDAEAYGVDISGPCLKLVNKRAQERGYKIHLSQQDIEKLDYPDNFFDLVMFTFMWHEIPPGPTKRILKEVERILKPGGVCFGMEFLPQKGSPWSEAMSLSSSYANNEPFAPASFKYPYCKTAKEVGFSDAKIVWYDEIMSPLPTDKWTPPQMMYPLYTFTK